MASTIGHLFAGLVPPTPASARDDLARLQYERFTQTLPLFHIIVILMTLAAGYAALDSNSSAASMAVPAIVLTLTTYRLTVWFRRKSESVDAALIPARVSGFLIVSVMLTLISSAWCVWAWLNADVGQRGNIPIFIIMGAIMALNCNMVHRLAAALTIIVGMMPITLVMLLRGQGIETIIGGCFFILAVLQIRIILQQHDQLVETIGLNQQTHILANTDALTSLANRRAFVSAVEKRLAEKPGSEFCLLMIDLNGFKKVNDCYGHLAGDALIEAVAGRLSIFENELIFPARLGGDEFGIIVDARSDTVDHLGVMAALTASLSAPYEIDGKVMTVFAAIGASHYPENGATFAELMQAADRALYAAKPGSHRLDAAPNRTRRAA
jgi:diguanylate cyclase (GGDEF)-like protein